MSSEAFGYDQHLKLFSETGYHLAIRSNGLVEGTEDDEDPDCNLEIINGGGPGLVRIKGIKSNLCLSFDDKGHLYGEKDLTLEDTVFEETLEGLHNAYVSVKHPGWFVGIKKNGRSKAGPVTKYGQRAVRFLPRRHH